MFYRVYLYLYINLENEVEPIKISSNRRAGHCGSINQDEGLRPNCLPNLKT
jgi:hypothetical protein